MQNRSRWYTAYLTCIGHQEGDSTFLFELVVQAACLIAPSTDLEFILKLLCYNWKKKVKSTISEEHVVPLKQLNEKCTVIACNYTPKWCPSEAGKGN